MPNPSLWTYTAGQKTGCTDQPRRTSSPADWALSWEVEDQQGTGSKFTPASANDALSTESFWRNMWSISPQELKDKDERNGERRNASASDQAFEKWRGVTSRGIWKWIPFKKTAEIALKMLSLKPEQLVEVGATNFTRVGFTDVFVTSHF